MAKPFVRKSRNLDEPYVRGDSRVPDGAIRDVVGSLVSPSIIKQRKKHWDAFFLKYSQKNPNDKVLNLETLEVEENPDDSYISHLPLQWTKHACQLQYWVDTGNSPHTATTGTSQTHSISLSLSEGDPADSSRLLIKQPATNGACTSKGVPCNKSISSVSSVDTIAYLLANGKTTTMKHNLFRPSQAIQRSDPINNGRVRRSRAARKSRAVCNRVSRLLTTISENLDRSKFVHDDHLDDACDSNNIRANDLSWKTESAKENLQSVVNKFNIGSFQTVDGIPAALVENKSSSDTSFDSILERSSLVRRTRKLFTQTDSIVDVHSPIQNSFFRRSFMKCCSGHPALRTPSSSVSRSSTGKRQFVANSRKSRRLARSEKSLKRALLPVKTVTDTENVRTSEKTTGSFGNPTVLDNNGFISDTAQPEDTSLQTPTACQNSMKFQSTLRTPCNHKRSLSNVDDFTERKMQTDDSEHNSNAEIEQDKRYAAQRLLSSPKMFFVNVESNNDAMSVRSLSNSDCSSSFFSRTTLGLEEFVQSTTGQIKTVVATKNDRTSQDEEGNDVNTVQNSECCSIFANLLKEDLNTEKTRSSGRLKTQGISNSIFPKGEKLISNSKISSETSLPIVERLNSRNGTLTGRDGKLSDIQQETKEIKNFDDAKNNGLKSTIKSTNLENLSNERNLNRSKSSKQVVLDEDVEKMDTTPCTFGIPGADGPDEVLGTSSHCKSLMREISPIKNMNSQSSTTKAAKKNTSKKRKSSEVSTVSTHLKEHSKRNASVDSRTNIVHLKDLRIVLTRIDLNRNSPKVNEKIMPDAATKSKNTFDERISPLPSSDKESSSDDVISPRLLRLSHNSLRRRKTKVDSSPNNEMTVEANLASPTAPTTQTQQTKLCTPKQSNTNIANAQDVRIKENRVKLDKKSNPGNQETIAEASTNNKKTFDKRIFLFLSSEEESSSADVILPRLPRSSNESLRRQKTKVDSSRNNEMTGEENLASPIASTNLTQQTKLSTPNQSDINIANAQDVRIKANHVKLDKKSNPGNQQTIVEGSTSRKRTFDRRMLFFLSSDDESSLDNIISPRRTRLSGKVSKRQTNEVDSSRNDGMKAERNVASPKASTGQTQRIKPSESQKSTLNIPNAQDNRIMANHVKLHKNSVVRTQQTIVEASTSGRKPFDRRILFPSSSDEESSSDVIFTPRLARSSDKVSQSQLPKNNGSVSNDITVEENVPSPEASTSRTKRLHSNIFLRSDVNVKPTKNIDASYVNEQLNDEIVLTDKKSKKGIKSQAKKKKGFTKNHLIEESSSDDSESNHVKGLSKDETRERRASISYSDVAFMKRIFDVESFNDNEDSFLKSLDQITSVSKTNADRQLGSHSTLNNASRSLSEKERTRYLKNWRRNRNIVFKTHD